MDVHFTDRELDLMTALWDAGSGTVAEVRQRLAIALAYTTVLTELQTLEEKGFVDHRVDGKAYRYFPLVDRQAAGASAVRRLVNRLFSNSPHLLLAHLVEDKHLTEEQLLNLQQLLNARLRDVE